MNKDLTKVILPAVCEPKFDGEYALWDGEKLVNRLGSVKYLPFCDNLPKDMKIVGELYLPSGKRNFYEALPLLKSWNKEPAQKYLEFVAYGMLSSGMRYYNQIEELRLKLLWLDRVSVIEGITAYSEAEVKLFCEKYVEEGWEGAVIKPVESTIQDNWIKYKPDQEADLVVVALSRRSQSVAVGTDDGVIYGHCPIPKDLEERIKRYMIIGRDSEHYYIEPDIVVEVAYLQVIKLNGKTSLRSPRIKRIRFDKSPSEADRL